LLSLTSSCLPSCDLTGESVDVYRSLRFPWPPTATEGVPFLRRRRGCGDRIGRRHLHLRRSKSRSRGHQTVEASYRKMVQNPCGRRAERVRDPDGRRALQWAGNPVACRGRGPDVVVDDHSDNQWLSCRRLNVRPEQNTAAYCESDAGQDPANTWFTSYSAHNPTVLRQLALVTCGTQAAFKLSRFAIRRVPGKRGSFHPSH
jgi:hypothetical protein